MISSTRYAFQAYGIRGGDNFPRVTWTSSYCTQLAKMNFDHILDLTADYFIHFNAYLVLRIYVFRNHNHKRVVVSSLWYRCCSAVDHVQWRRGMIVTKEGRINLFPSTGNWFAWYGVYNVGVKRVPKWLLHAVQATKRTICFNSKAMALSHLFCR